MTNSLLLELLASPRKFDLSGRHCHLEIDAKIADEIDEIAACSTEQFAARTLLRVEVPQLRAIQISTRLAPQHVLHSVVRDCAREVLPLLHRDYPHAPEPTRAVQLLGSMDDVEELSGLFQELKVLQTRIRHDNDEKHHEEFAAKGRIPLERGIVLDSVVSAMSVVVLAVVAFLPEYGDELIETVDQVVVRFFETKPLNARSDAGDWVVERMVYYLELG